MIVAGRHLQIASVALGGAIIASATGATPATPAPPGSGLKPISQAALETTIDAAARAMLVPGAVVLLRTPQGNFTITYGTAKLGTTTPLSTATYFRIASNTKTMTAAIVLQLAQEGKLKLDDPVSKYVARVPDGDRITIAQLLEMRSGLYNYTDSPVLSEAVDRDQGKPWTPDQLLTIAFAHPANFAPGASYEYSNTNYALLGLIIEQLDGKPLAQSMQDRLFGPLGLRHTVLPASTDTAIPDPFSHGYLYGSSAVAFAGPASYTPAMKAAARAGTLLPTDYTGVNHSFAGAAGGVISNADDLATWIRALVTGRVLDAAYQQQWLDSLRPVDPAKPEGQRYGYGITELHWASNAVYFHGGETAGYNSFMGYDPSNGVTLVIWTNLTVSLDDIPTANALMLKVLDQIYTVSPLSTPSPSPTASP